MRVFPFTLILFLLLYHFFTCGSILKQERRKKKKDYSQCHLKHFCNHQPHLLAEILLPATDPLISLSLQGVFVSDTQDKTYFVPFNVVKEVLDDGKVTLQERNAYYNQATIPIDMQPFNVHPLPVRQMVCSSRNYSQDQSFSVAMLIADNKDINSASTLFDVCWRQPRGTCIQLRHPTTLLRMSSHGYYLLCTTNFSPIFYYFLLAFVLIIGIGMILFTLIQLFTRDAYVDAISNLPSTVMLLVMASMSAILFSQPSVNRLYSANSTNEPILEFNGKVMSASHSLSRILVQEYSQEDFFSPKMCLYLVDAIDDKVKKVKLDKELLKYMSKLTDLRELENVSMESVLIYDKHGRMVIQELYKEYENGEDKKVGGNRDGKYHTLPHEDQFKSWFPFVKSQQRHIFHFGCGIVDWLELVDDKNKRQPVNKLIDLDNLKTHKLIDSTKKLRWRIIRQRLKDSHHDGFYYNTNGNNSTIKVECLMEMSPEAEFLHWSSDGQVIGEVLFQKDKKRVLRVYGLEAYY